MIAAALFLSVAMCATQDVAIPADTKARIAWALESVQDRDDPAARELGRRVLVQMGDAGVDALLVAAKSSYWRGRAEGIAGLGELGRCPPDLALAALADPQWPLRIAGIRALPPAPPPDLAARLVALLSDPISGVRAAALFALIERRIMDPAHLEQALLDPDEASGRAAAAGLRELGEHISAETYAKWLSDPRMRRRVLTLLAEHPASAAAAAVERDVRTEPEAELRELAMLALPPQALGETVLEHVTARLGSQAAPDLRLTLRLALRLPAPQLATLFERGLAGGDDMLGLVLAVTGRAPASLDERALVALDDADEERLGALIDWLTARAAAGGSPAIRERRLPRKLAQLVAARRDARLLATLIGAAAPFARETPEVVAALHRHLSPEAGTTTTAAVRALAGAGRVDERLWSAAARGDDTERPARLAALLDSPAARDVPTAFFAGLLRDPLVSVRRLCCRGLAGRTLDDDVALALETLASDPTSPETSRDALVALIRSGCRGPVVALVPRFEERRAEATLALAYDRLGRGNEPWQIDLLRAGLGGVCAEDALLALARRGDAGARSEILRTLSSRSLAFLRKARDAVAPGIRAEDLASIRLWLTGTGDQKPLAAEFREEVVELLALRPDLDSGSLLAMVFAADPYLAVRTAAARALLRTGRGAKVLEFVGRCVAEGFGETEEDLLFEVIDAIGAVPGPEGASLLVAALIRSTAEDPLGSVARTLARTPAGRPQAAYPLLVPLLDALASADAKHVGPALDAELARAELDGSICCIGKDWILNALGSLSAPPPPSAQSSQSVQSSSSPSPATRSLLLDRFAALCLRLSPVAGHPADGVAALLLARSRALDPARLEEAAELFERANLLLARVPLDPRVFRHFLADLDTEAGVHPAQAVAAAPALCRAIAAAARGDAARARELARIAAARAPDDAETLAAARRLLEEGK